VRADVPFHTVEGSFEKMLHIWKNFRGNQFILEILRSMVWTQGRVIASLSSMVTSTYKASDSSNTNIVSIDRYRPDCCRAVCGPDMTAQSFFADTKNLLNPSPSITRTSIQCRMQSHHPISLFIDLFLDRSDVVNIN
jgi:hypothetical protein